MHWWNLFESDLKLYIYSIIFVVTKFQITLSSEWKPEINFFLFHSIYKVWITINIFMMDKILLDWGSVNIYQQKTDDLEY